MNQMTGPKETKQAAGHLRSILTNQIMGPPANTLSLWSLSVDLRNKGHPKSPTLFHASKPPSRRSFSSFTWLMPSQAQCHPSVKPLLTYPALNCHQNYRPPLPFDSTYHILLYLVQFL